MTKHYRMTEAQKKANMAKSVSKYKDKIKDDEIFCDACLCTVKKLSVFNHNRGKKHIEKSKSVVKDIVSVFKKAVEKLETGVNIKETAREIFYYLKNEYFDENECELLDDSEQFTDPEAKTPEEKEFCSQLYNHMAIDIDNMIEDLSDENLYDNLQEQRDKVDANKPSAKKLLLNIYRRIKSSLNKVDEPLKVKIQEIKLDEDFPTYSRFIKASDKEKLKCLEFIVHNQQQIFDENRDLTIAIDTIESENVDYYDEVYSKILKLKSEYDINMELHGEEEEAED